MRHELLVRLSGDWGGQPKHDHGTCMEGFCTLNQTICT